VRNLNLGVVAHVDAGKTTLTERLLYAAGVIDEVGSVDRGSTQTDTLALERQRGITIKSAVVSLETHGIRVNLIDTPGHPDFIAEVERALSVLDGAVLVVSAVEGVQAQTRILMRALQRLGIPTLILVNKIDRAGARHEGLLDELRERLTPSIVPMGAPDALGTRAAVARSFTPADAAFVSVLADRLSEHDDALLASLVADDFAMSVDRLLDLLADQTRRALVHPVFFGSALTGAGVDALMAALPMLANGSEADTDGPLSATVFKVERGRAGERLGYVRVHSGVIRPRDVVQVGGRESKVTGIRMFDRGTAVASSSAEAGRIAVLSGLGDVRIGDTVGVERPRSTPQFYAPPTLETVVAPVQPGERGRLHVALTQLAEQDPLINLREDDTRHEAYLSLYGEVQKEVVAATLADDFGLEVAFKDSVTICIERPRGSGEAVEVIKGGDNPFLATVGLRVEPAAIGSGVSFGFEVELGAMPYAFFRAVEETVRATLTQGLCGWEVQDVAVIMTRSGYWPRQSRMHGTFDKSISSTAGDFRGLTPLVVMDALRRAGTDVLEPMHRFRLETPADVLGAATSALAQFRAVALEMDPGRNAYVVDGEIPAASVHALRQALPGLTRGEGLLDTAFSRYQVVRGTPPRRARWGHDPLDRKRYLLAVTRQRLVEAGLG
jgi:ribosomal protection tetracycline resistance protein